jgi:sec-independent protein translocase protein TatC
MNQKVNELSFLDHLDELRSRLIKSFVAVIVAACFFYSFIDSILTVLIRPVGRVVFTSPSDAFVARVTLAVCGGIVLAVPVILYQIWMFVSEGLKEREKRYVYFFGPCSLILFILGALFAYFVMIPVSIKFLLSFSTESIVPMITLQNYISFVGMLILAFGVVFELPLVLMFLTKIGVVTPLFLSEKRRHAVVLILIVSAVLTPPDAVTQLIMAGPLTVLYELGILISRLVYKKNL